MARTEISRNHYDGGDVFSRFESFSNDELTLLIDGLEEIAFGDRDTSTDDDAKIEGAIELGNEAVAELKDRGGDTSPWRGYFQEA